MNRDEFEKKFEGEAKSLWDRYKAWAAAHPGAVRDIDLFALGTGFGVFLSWLVR